MSITDVLYLLFLSGNNGTVMLDEFVRTYQTEVSAKCAFSERTVHFRNYCTTFRNKAEISVH